MARPSVPAGTRIMTQFLEPLNQRVRHFADIAQPVIIAMGTAGITGGAMAAFGLLADRTLQARQDRAR